MKCDVVAKRLTAVLNRVRHGLVKQGMGCRVLGVVNAKKNRCKRKSSVFFSLKESSLLEVKR
jgi:hypothetical protein